MYSGKMASYVRCEECGKESLNEMNFMDLSLPIKNEFGTGVLNSSVEMALENYIKPEKLDGDNKYMCDNCAKKVNAEKGLKLTSCPPVLMLHLARFTLDWDTLQRVKIYDRVSFPFILNMNDYIKGYEGIQNKLYEKEVLRMR
jgi:ubiquitin carboxyl-terminal hydrolase 47